MFKISTRTVTISQEANTSRGHDPFSSALSAESSGRIETVETEGESAELKGLMTYSNYSVAVAAFTRAGAGGADVAAARVFCMTAEDGECSEFLKIPD